MSDTVDERERPEQPPPPGSQRRLTIVLFFMLGALLFALVCILVGALFLSAVDEEMSAPARTWVALVIALSATLLLPSFLALRLSKSALSATRIFAGCNLLLALGLLGLTTGMSRRALLEHGAWPSELVGERAETWVDATSAVGELLPGAAEEQAPAVETAPKTAAGLDAGLDAGTTATPDELEGAAAVFARAADSVVYIGVRSVVKPGSIEAKLLESLGMKEIEGHGSGFVVSPDGLVVTNHHVAGGARSALVRLRDGRSFSEVQVLARDPGNDLALLKIDAAGLTPLALSEADDIKVGSEAYAIGSPLGLDFTLTSGIVSAQREQQETTFLQVQTTIAPGSSGGPMLDDQGRVIGVSTATRGAGLNLAVHVRHVRALLEAAHKAEALEPWKAAAELTAIKYDGGEPLPTSRAQLEMMLKFAATVVDGCVEELPTEGAQLELSLAEEMFKDPKTSSNLGAKTEKCSAQALSMVAMQTSVLLRQQPGTSRVSCTFKGLRAGDDERPAEQRTLQLIISLPEAKHEDAGTSSGE